MINCPLCGSKTSYVGLSKIECKGAGCNNNPAGKNKTEMIKNAWNTGVINEGLWQMLYKNVADNFNKEYLCEWVQ
jgi:hypothetical protein